MQTESKIWQELLKQIPILALPMLPAPQPPCKRQSLLPPFTSFCHRPPARRCNDVDTFINYDDEENDGRVNSSLGNYLGGV